MFSEFFEMMGNYEQRKVAHDERWETDLVVDTAAVTDSALPYETAVQHPDYHDGDWVIVQTYATREAALEGHAQWVERLTTEPLPDELQDVGTSWLVEMLEGLVEDAKAWRTFKRTPKEVGGAR